MDLRQRSCSNPYEPGRADSHLELASGRLSVLGLGVCGIGLVAGIVLLFVFDRFSKFGDLLWQALSVMGLAWPIALLIAVWICYACDAGVRQWLVSRVGISWVSPMLLMPLGILAVGAVVSQTHIAGVSVVSALYFCAFAQAMYWLIAVLMNKGRRILVFGIGFFLQLLSLSSALTAASSVLRTWI